MQHKKTPKSNGSKKTYSHIYNSTNRCAAHATTSSARPSEQHPGGQPLLWPVWPSPVIRVQRQQVPRNWMGVQTRQLTLTGRVTFWWHRALSQGRRHTRLPQLHRQCPWQSGERMRKNTLQLRTWQTTPLTVISHIGGKYI